MPYFSQLNTAITKVVQILISNQNLCKYIYYTDSATPLNSPTITDPSSLIFTNIFPLPKDSKSVGSTKAFLNVHFPQAKHWSENNGFNKISLRFDVVCHIDAWKINGGLRPYSILNEIDLLFNNKSIQMISDQKIWLESVTEVQYGDYFYGFAMIYTLTQASNVGCSTK